MRRLSPAEGVLAAGPARSVAPRRRSPLGLALPALAVAAAVNVPLVYLFIRAGRAGGLL